MHLHDITHNQCLLFVIILNFQGEERWLLREKKIITKETTLCVCVRGNVPNNFENNIDNIPTFFLSYSFMWALCIALPRAREFLNSVGSCLGHWYVALLLYHCHICLGWPWRVIRCTIYAYAPYKCAQEHSNEKNRRRRNTLSYTHAHLG